MTAREKSIIETILTDVGLESLNSGADGKEPKSKPEIMQKHHARSGYRNI